MLLEVQSRGSVTKLFVANTCGHADDLERATKQHLEVLWSLATSGFEWLGDLKLLWMSRRLLPSPKCRSSARRLERIHRQSPTYATAPVGDSGHGSFAPHPRGHRKGATHDPEKQRPLQGPV